MATPYLLIALPVSIIMMLAWPLGLGDLGQKGVVRTALACHHQRQL